MTKIEALIEKLSNAETTKRASYAKMTNICKICGQPANAFDDELSELEYRVSAICQDCQDRYFR